MRWLLIFVLPEIVVAVMVPGCGGPSETCSLSGLDRCVQDAGFGDGQGPSPAALAISSVLPFPPAFAGTGSISEQLTIRNDGSQDSGPIHATLGGGDYAIANSCTTLSSTQDCTISISLTPTDVRTYTDSMTIAASPGGMLQVPLVVTARAHTLAASPATIDFGAQQPGVASTPRDVIVTNTQATASGPLTVEVTTPVFAATGCTGMSLPPGGTCTVSVAYTPMTATSGDHGTLTIASAAGGVGVPLHGTGVGASTLTATPVALMFPNTVAGTTSPGFTITIENTSNHQVGPLNTVLINDFGNFQITSDPCSGAFLGVTATCTLIVVFTPTATGPALSTVINVIGPDPPTDEVDIPLSGNGT